MRRKWDGRSATATSIGDDAAWDAAEAEQLYSLLEREIVPQFYQRNENRDSHAMGSRASGESMARLTPHFSANRAVREYTAEHYVPASAAYAARAAEGGRAGAGVLEWSQRSPPRGATFLLARCMWNPRTARSTLLSPFIWAAVDPDAVRVELFAEGPGGESPVVRRWIAERSLPPNGFIYTAGVEANRRANDFTPRVVPYHPGAAVPLEANQILWQK